MAKNNEKVKEKLPFIKAYMFILNDPDLIPAEKLVLLVVCRYLPDFCYHTNRQIAEICGFSERYIEKLVSRLKAKKRIKTGYSHTSKNGSPYTVRVMVPARVPKETNYRLENEASRTNGRELIRTTVRLGTRTIGSFYPNDRGANARTAGRPTKTNKKELDSAALPLPAKQASATQNKQCFRTRCEKIGVDYEFDDNRLPFWWCEEHYPYSVLGKGWLKNSGKKVEKF